MKVAIITCYDQNDYVRARTLRAAFQAADDVDVKIIRNENKGLKRYAEVPFKIIKARFGYRPDAYVITFRGYEMLLFMVLTLSRKPIIFDEMINFTEWMEEHKVFKNGSLGYKLFRLWYGWLARRCRIILADTDAHAHYSAELNKMDLKRYRTIPVGTDETVFYPRPHKAADHKKFIVFYYGHMLPLHGLDYVLEAAEQLKNRREITFRFVGGKDKVAQACKAAQENGAHVTHEAWVPFEELPQAAINAGLTLGGPFGKTLQSQYVVTGKTYQFLALGTPVLIGKNKVNDGFRDKQNCLLVPEADAAAITKAIEWAYDHPNELESIGKAGRQLYEQHFSQAIINAAVQKLVAELR